MIINLLLTIFGIVLLGALVFFSWVLWGAFRYGAPLISSSKKVTKRMVELADLHSEKRVYDLGCGVGTILFAVVKKQSPALFEPEPQRRRQSPRIKEERTQCIGYDLVRPAIWCARIKNYFLKTNIQFECVDFFEKNVSDADVIFCYLLPEVMNRLYTEKWKELPTGCRIVSHGFPIRPLQPTHVVQVGKDKIYMYEKV